MIRSRNGWWWKVIDLYCPDDWEVISTEDRFIVFSNGQDEVVVEIGDFVGYITVKKENSTNKNFGPFPLDGIEFELEDIFAEFF